MHVIGMSLPRYSYVLVCHPYVTGRPDIHMLFVSTRMSSVCHWYVVVCHPYVTRMYSYANRMSLVCTRMSSACHSSVVLPWTIYSRLFCSSIGSNFFVLLKGIHRVSVLKLLLFSNINDILKLESHRFSMSV